MPRTMKAYLPRWILWIIIPMLVLIWGFITYSAFATVSDPVDGLKTTPRVCNRDSGWRRFLEVLTA